MAAAVLAPSSTTSAGPVGGATTRPIGFRPLSSAAAAARVHRRAWEPRPQNGPYGHPPTAAQLAYFHRFDGQTDDCGLRAHVDGNFSGTTDETIQWTAWKWGIDEDVARAEAETETTWDHYAWAYVHPGDGGHSFGLYQIKVGVHKGFDPQADSGGSPSHGGGSAGSSMSLNADYYGYVIRAAMNGCEGWLAGVDTSAHPYPARNTDEALWGAVGRWFSGQWWRSSSDAYRATVRRHLADRDWANASWFYGRAGRWPAYGSSRTRRPSAGSAAAAGARALTRALSRMGLLRLARAGSASVSFAAPAGGTETLTVVTARGRTVFGFGKKRFTVAGRRSVRVRLSAHGRSLARRAHSVAVVVKSTFAPRRGRAASSFRRVTLKR